MVAAALLQAAAQEAAGQEARAQRPPSGTQVQAAVRHVMTGVVDPAYNRQTRQ